MKFGAEKGVNRHKSYCVGGKTEKLESLAETISLGDYKTSNYTLSSKLSTIGSSSLGYMRNNEGPSVKNDDDHKSASITENNTPDEVNGNSPSQQTGISKKEYTLSIIHQSIQAK